MPDRCPWATSAPDYLTYHDDEWGRPVTDDRGLYADLDPQPGRCCVVLREANQDRS